MKKFLISQLILFVVLSVAIWAGLKFYLDPKLKTLIEEKGSEVLEVPLHVRSVETQIFPFKISVKEIGFEKSQRKLKVQIEEAKLNLDVLALLAKKIKFALLIKKPSVEVTMTAKVPGQNKASQQAEAVEVFSPSQTLAQFSYEVSGVMAVESGHTLVHQPEGNMEIKEFSLNLQVPDLKQDWILKAGCDVDVSSPALHVPVYLDTRFSLTDDVLIFKDSKLIVMGVDIGFKGSSNLITLKQDWKFESQIPQIEALKAPMDVKCAKLQSGSIDISIVASTQNDFKNPQASGRIGLQRIKALLQCDMVGTKAQGPLTFSSDVTFRYAGSVSGNEMSLEKLKVDADLTGVNIAYVDMFTKSSQVPMSVSVDGATQGKIFQLRQGSLLLERLKLHASGALAMSLDGSSDFQVALPSTRLEGLEKFFPMLKDSPVKGEIEVLAKINGPLTNPDTLNLQLAPFKAKGVQASVNWENADKTMRVKGPLLADMDLTLKSRGRELLEGRAKAFVDMSGMSIQTQQMTKLPRQPLVLEMIASQKGQRLEFSNSQLRIPGGIVFVKGSVAEFSKPLMSLQLSAQGFKLAPLLKMMPKAAKYTVSGTFNANMNLSGRYDLAGGIEKSPLVLKGQADANLDQVTVPAEKKHVAKAGDMTVESPPLSAEPFLPLWPIMRSLDLTIKSHITSLQYENLPVKGISSSHVIRGGVMTSTGIIQSLFSGRLVLKSSYIPLLQSAPTIQFGGTAQGIQLGEAVAWASQEWKDLAKGSADGDVEFKIAHPSRKDFIKATEGRGTLKVKNGFLSTLQFDKMANDRLSKIPGLGDKANVASKGATADILAVFTMSDGKINFSQLIAVTPEKNEMRTKGWVSAVEKTCEISGDVFLSDPPVKGSIREANSDLQGRLQVPVSIKGSVFSPDVDIASTTVQAMLEKTARYEGEKLKQKLTQDAQKKGQEMGNKLKEEAEKKLKGLLGQ